MSAWPIVPVKDYARVVGGATPKSGTAEYWDGDIPWTTPKDLSDLDGKYLADTPRKITASGLKSCSSELLPPNSVLFSSRAPIGHVAINTVPMATNQGFKSFVPGPKLDASFLYWWLKCHRAQLELLGNGATFKEVSKAIVERIEIPLPPLDEQKRIAAILDQADELRRKRQRAIDRLDQLGQAVFHEMFGDPMLNPNGYPCRELQDLIDPQRPITYGILKPGPDTSGGVPYVRVVDIKNDRVLVDKLKRTTLDIARSYRRSTLKQGDLLISIRGHVGRMAIAPKECEGANITQDTARLSIVGADPIFVKYLLSSPSVSYWMDQRIRGIAVRGINLGDLRKAPVILPPTTEQEKFALIIVQIEQQSLAARSQASCTIDLLASLQHRAFQGEL